MTRIPNVALAGLLALLGMTACLQAPDRKGFADTNAATDTEAPADTPEQDVPNVPDTPSPSDTPDAPSPSDTADTPSPSDTPDTPSPPDTVDAPDVPEPDRFSRLCRPCLTDAECVPDGVQANGQACVARGVDGSFCGTQCATDTDCPQGYECPPHIGQCIPVAAGACPCPAGFESFEMACRRESEHGTCHGTVVCGGICDAAYPLAEQCNDIDDDCDDQTDEGNPCDDGQDCTDDACTDDHQCTHTYRIDFCTHSGQCYADGQPLASNACQVCDGSELPAKWKTLPPGTTCGPGMACRMGVCEISHCPEGYAEIPSGSFNMGSPPTEPLREDDETRHPVTITKAFCMKATEVTQAEWKLQVGAAPSYFAQCGATCPVENVSWWEALAFCNHMSSLEGLDACYTLKSCVGTLGQAGFQCSQATFAGLACTGYRLPTEAEWEYAARAGTQEATYNGTVSSALGQECSQDIAVLSTIAWYCGNATGTPHPVGMLGPNDWGLYDMLGNVQEWVFDGPGGYPSDDTPAVDPVTPGDTLRVVRGGAWNLDARAIRAANRDVGGPDYRGGNMGFRMVRAAAP